MANEKLENTFGCDQWIETKAVAKRCKFSQLQQQQLKQKHAKTTWKKSKQLQFDDHDDETKTKTKPKTTQERPTQIDGFGQIDAPFDTRRGVPSLSDELVSL